MSKIHEGNEKHLRNISRQAKHHYSFSFQHKTHSLLLKTNIMNLKKIPGNSRIFIEMILIGCFDILILILADHINHGGVTRAGETDFTIVRLSPPEHDEDHLQLPITVTKQSAAPASPGPK